MDLAQMCKLRAAIAGLVKLMEDTQHGVHGVLAHKLVEMGFTQRLAHAQIHSLNSMD